VPERGVTVDHPAVCAGKRRLCEAVWGAASMPFLAAGDAMNAHSCSPARYYSPGL